MKKSIQDLIELFADNLDDYVKTTFNETQTRIQFVDPLFSALGWDLGNESGYSEDYKEVIHSDSLKDEGRTKAPDYAFRVGRERKFFVEAKRPSVDLSKDRAAAYQIRRYAWSAKLPLSILTNFRQFAVYDTRVKPKKTDQPKTGRIMFLAFRDYPSRFIELERLFSKDAILKGAFDRFAAEKTRKGTAPVDEDFLASLEAWRLRLAVSIYRYNPTLDTADLSYAVQGLLDRVLFLRICEDKGLERFGDLIPKTKTGLYRELLETFRHAQQRYNSSLFYLHPEGKKTSR